MDQIPKKIILNGIEILNLDRTSAQPTDVANGRTYFDITGTLVEGTDEVTSSTLGTLDISENRVYTPTTEDTNVGGWNYINVNVIPKLQQKTATPSKERQTVIADYGNDGLSSVTVNPIPSQYIVPSGNLDITSNGPANVAQYETILVNVGAGGSAVDIASVTSTPEAGAQSLIVHNCLASVTDTNTILIGVI